MIKASLAAVGPLARVSLSSCPVSDQQGRSAFSPKKWRWLRVLAVISLAWMLAAPAALVQAKKPTAEELGPRKDLPQDPEEVMEGLKTFEEAIDKVNQQAKDNEPVPSVRDTEDKAYKERVKLDDMEQEPGEPWDKWMERYRKQEAKTDKAYRDAGDARLKAGADLGPYRKALNQRFQLREWLKKWKKRLQLLQKADATTWSDAMNRKVAEAIIEADQVIQQTKKAVTVSMLGDTRELPPGAMYAAGNASKWNFSFGAIAQSSRVSFSSTLRAQDFGVSFPKIGGSTNLYGGADAYVKYTDGSVSHLDSFAQANGFATFTGGDVRGTGRTRIGLADVDTLQAEFRSARKQHDGGVTVDDATFGKIAPYIEANFTLKECETGRVSLFSQYACYDIDQSSGWTNGKLGGQQYTFNYQGIDRPTGPDRVFFDPLIINGSPFSANPPFMAPARRIAEIGTRSRASLDLQQHQFSLGARASMPFRLLKPVELFVAAGATMTISDFDYNAESQLWIGGSRVATRKVSDTGQKVQFGCVAETGVRIDLGRAWFLEGAFRFDWANPITVGNGSDEAEIGNESIGGRLGIGFLF